MILTRLIPAVVFVAIFVAHALYVSACAASALSGWTDFGISADVVGPLGLGGLLARTGLFHRFFLCVSCGVRGVGAQWQHPLSSRKDRYGGSRCRRVDAFGSAHGRRLFSNRLLWITDASRLPEPVRSQSLGLGQTINGIDNSDLCQLWLLVPFAEFRAGKHLHGRLLLWVRHLHWGSRNIKRFKVKISILRRAADQSTSNSARINLAAGVDFRAPGGALHVRDRCHQVERLSAKCHGVARMQLRVRDGKGAKGRVLNLCPVIFTPKTT